MPALTELVLASVCGILEAAGPRLDGDLALHWDPADPEPRARSRRRMDQHFNRLWLWADVRTVGISEALHDQLHVSACW